MATSPNPATSADSVPTHLVIPFLALTADKCSTLSERGEEVIPLLGQGKSARMLKSRFMRANARLRKIAERGSYGTTREDLQADLQAIATSSDFYQIAGVLPREMPPHIVRDLAKALEGDVGTRVPDKFLSQYWVGVLLARGGVSPGVMREKKGRPNPDFQVAVDTLECAIEVKRPESEHSAQGAMDKAAGQLRDFGKPGLIAMDLTDALFTPSMAVDFMDDPGLLNAVVNPRFARLTTRLENRPPKYKLSDKYARIIGTAFFARFHFWEKPDLTQPKGRYLLSLTTYSHACNGLVVNQAEKLKRIIFAGAGEVAGGGVRRMSI